MLLKRTNSTNSETNPCLIGFGTERAIPSIALKAASMKSA